MARIWIREQNYYYSIPLRRRRWSSGAGKRNVTRSRQVVDYCVVAGHVFWMSD